MQDYVSFETAVKLKEAAFPQPERLVFGQMYYVRHITESGRPVYYLTVIQDDNECLAYKPIFAPRVTDILLHLPEGCELQIETQHGEPNPMWYMFPPSDWVYENEGKYIAPEGNENPAEAAAQMWIKLKEQ